MFAKVTEWGNLLFEVISYNSIKAMTLILE